MADETSVPGGMSETRILRVLRPHLFSGGQLDHMNPAAEEVPVVHASSGVADQPAHGAGGGAPAARWRAPAQEPDTRAA